MDNSIGYMIFLKNYPLENSGQFVIYHTEFSIYELEINLKNKKLTSELTWLPMV